MGTRGQINATDIDKVAKHISGNFFSWLDLILNENIFSCIYLYYMYNSFNAFKFNHTKKDAK